MNENKEHQIVAMLPEEIFIKFKLLSAGKLIKMKDLLIEAINDLLVKYENQRNNRV